MSFFLFFVLIAEAPLSEIYYAGKDEILWDNMDQVLSLNDVNLFSFLFLDPAIFPPIY